jgi:hypothetical protein
MFLRPSHRKKNGKDHRYGSIVENRRWGDGRVVQRHVRYLGEINDAQERAWTRSIEVDATQATLTYRLNQDKLRQVRRREGRYLLRCKGATSCFFSKHFWLRPEAAPRSNLTETDPAVVWNYHLQLVEVEQAFRHLKGDLAIRPIFHQDQRRIEAHLFVSFLAYCLHVTLGRWLRDLAPGLTSRSALEKFAALQMVDVQIPTSDGRTLILRRYTPPQADLRLLRERLKLKLPAQPPPRIIVASDQTEPVT